MSYRIRKNRFGLEFVESYDTEKYGEVHAVEFMARLRKADIPNPKKYPDGEVMPYGGFLIGTYDDDGNMIAPVPEKYMNKDELKALADHRKSRSRKTRADD